MLPILYRDPQLIAIHKPSNLLVHRSELDRHETRFAIQLLRDQIGQRVYPVHRLDKGTSGVLLFALDKDSAREMSWQFERQEVSKRYLAVVRGRIRPYRPRPQPPRGRPGLAGRKVQPGPQEAQTDYAAWPRWSCPSRWTATPAAAMHWWSCRRSLAAATSCAAT
jgi:tRNA pseudouridine65 synthase